MNRTWAIDKLKGFLHAAELEPPRRALLMPSIGPYVLKHPSQARAAAQIAEQILDRVLPDWRTAEWDQPVRQQPMWRHREACHRAIAQLEAEQELIDNLGSGAPQLDAATLHPWVWGSVAGLWSSGHFREAVSAAARAINAQAQAKLGRRDASEARLLSDAFSTNPPQAGHPRLRLADDDRSDTFRNLHDGAGNYARGVYAAIRNPLAHEDAVELRENEALEHLAAFSILARWIDTATVDSIG